MPLTIIRNNITNLKVDAIVNAANTNLQMGGGVCGAIFNAAGAAKLQAACKSLAPIKTGEAVITEGFKLPAKYIIHTAGPIYQGGNKGESALLYACYTNSLALATKHGCESIAFPLISSGIFGYPKAEALRVATTAIRDYIIQHDISVALVVFDKTSYEVSKDLLGEVKSFVSEYYVDEHIIKRLGLDEERRAIERRDADRCASEMPAQSRPFAPPPSPATKPSPGIAGAPLPQQIERFIPDESIRKKSALSISSLDNYVNNLDEPFSTTLLRLIDASGKKDSEVYRRANIDRRLFSKIRTSANYAPSKPTVLAFAIALELNLEQAQDLLERAGFALSRSRKFDVIVEYFLRRRRYDIFLINEVLFSYDQPLLGG